MFCSLCKASTHNTVECPKLKSISHSPPRSQTNPTILTQSPPDRPLPPRKPLVPKSPVTKNVTVIPKKAVTENKTVTEIQRPIPVTPTIPVTVAATAKKKRGRPHSTKPPLSATEKMRRYRARKTAKSAKTDPI